MVIHIMIAKTISIVAFVAVMAILMTSNIAYADNAPQGVELARNGDGTATLSWTAQDGIKKYIIKSACLATTNDDGSKLKGKIALDGDVQSHTFVVADDKLCKVSIRTLDENNVRSVNVKIVMASNESTGEIVQDVNNRTHRATDAALGLIPTSVTATAWADDTATVTWAAPSNTGSRTVDSYVVKEINDCFNNLAHSEPIYEESVDGNTLSIETGPASPNADDCSFKVRAVFTDGDKSVWSANADTDVSYHTAYGGGKLGKVTNFSATAVKDGNGADFTVEWSPPANVSDVPVDRYHVNLCVESSKSKYSQILSGGDASYTATISDVSKDEFHQTKFYSSGTDFTNAEKTKHGEVILDANDPFVCTVAVTAVGEGNYRQTAVVYENVVWNSIPAS